MAHRDRPAHIRAIRDAKERRDAYKRWERGEPEPKPAQERKAK